MVANAMFQAYLPTPAERKAERQRHQGAVFGRRSDGVFVRYNEKGIKMFIIKLTMMIDIGFHVLNANETILEIRLDS